MFSSHIPSKGAKSIADMLIYADDAELAVNIYYSGEDWEKKVIVGLGMCPKPIISN